MAGEICTVNEWSPTRFWRMTNTGIPAAKLVTSRRETEELRHLSDGVLADGEMEPLHRKLEELAAKEVNVSRTVERVEQQNRRIALGQEWMNFAVAKDLVEYKAASRGRQAALSPVLTELDHTVHAREELIVTALPASLFRFLSDDLLLHVRVPEVGETLRAVVPQVLLIPAMDAAKRSIGGMKRGKNELRLGMAIDRLTQEIRACERRLARGTH